jgi:hypothetical protein
MFKKYLPLLLLLLSGKGFALYNGNPSFPMMPEEGLIFKSKGWLTLKAGYEWDDLFDRKLKVRSHKEHLKRRVGDYSALGNFGVLTLGFNDRVEAYGVLGAEKAEIHYHPYTDTHLKFKTDYHFAWTVGGRAILAYWGNTQFAIDAKYFQFDPSLHSIKLNGKSLSTSGAHYHYDEWQIGLGVSQRINAFFPYLGLKYSNVQAKFRDLDALRSIFPNERFTLENRHPIGIFLGLGISLERALNFNFEARLYDETAITLSTDLRF